MSRHDNNTNAESSTAQAARLLWQAAQPDRRTVLWGLAWLILAAGLDAAGPVLGKYFIDRYLLPRDPMLSTMAALLLGVLITGSLASLMRYWQLTRLAGVAMRSVLRIREQVYGHVLRLPMSFFDQAITGQLVSRVTNDTESVKQLYVQVLFVMMDAVVMLGIMLVTMALLDVRLMLISAVMVPAVVAVVVGYGRLSGPAVARTRELRSQLNAQTAESIGGMVALQATGATARYGERYAEVNQAHYDSRLIEVRANAWLLRPALDLIHVLVLAVVIAAWGARSEGLALDALQVGLLYAFVGSLGRVTEPLIQLTMQFSQLQQATVSAARVHTLLAHAQAERPHSTGQVTAGAVSIRELDFAYQPDQPILKKVSLDIAPGEFIGIVGPTGSGKSTLLSLLLRYYPLQEPDQLRVDGQPLGSLDEDTFRHAVGLVPQEPFLMAGSVRDNIAMGRPLSQEALELAATQAGASGFITRLSEGYDTLLGEGGARLAVGEKQLIAIARALAGQPKILLLDEATSHIDTATEQVVQQALHALRGKMTLIAVAHRLSTIREADRILVLQQGRVVECGPHAALMQITDGVYRRLVELQQLHEDELGDGP